MKIVVEEDSFRRDGLLRNVSGIIYVSCNNVAFPSKDWSDFPVIIVGWWIDSILNITAENSHGEIAFMDGPYSLLISVGDGAGVHVRGERAGVEVFSQVTEISFSNLIENVLSVASRIEKVCKDRGWLGPDLDYMVQKKSILLAQLSKMS